MWQLSAQRTGGVVVLLLVSLFAGGCGGEPGRSEYREGLEELRAGGFTRARVLLEKSITRRPASDENAMAYNYLGIVSARLGQLDRAIDEFEESARLDPGLFAPRYNLGLLMYEGGNAERAQGLLEEAASIATRETRALEYLAHMHMESREWVQARAVLEEVLERVPGSPYGLSGMALVVQADEGTEAAVPYLMRALEKDPDYPPALYNLALAYERELDDPERALSFFSQYLEVAPAGVHRDYALRASERLAELHPPAPGTEDPGALAVPARPVVTEDEPAPPTPEELLAASRLAAQAGHTDEALARALEAAELARLSRDASGRERALRTAVSVGADRAEAQVAWGTYCLERARYAPALEAFKRATALAPRWVEAHLGLAEAAAETGEYDAALITLKRAVQLDERNAEALWALAVLYDQHLHMAQPAVHAYRRFDRLFPDDPRIVRAQARLKALDVPPPTPPAPEPPPAPQDATPAVTTTPPKEPVESGLAVRQPLVRNMRAAVQAYNRGIEYQERRDWDQAIYYYTRAIENDHTFANAYFNLGGAYRATRELALAKDAYLHAVQLQPRMVNGRYNLALVYMELGQNAAAVEQLRTAVRQEPTHAPSHYALGLLYSRNAQARDLARRHYRQFLDLAPSDPAAPGVRDWLRQH